MCVCVCPGYAVFKKPYLRPTRCSASPRSHIKVLTAHADTGDDAGNDQGILAPRKHTWDILGPMKMAL